jgi:hypothetical protein
MLPLINLYVNTVLDGIQWPGVALAGLGWETQRQPESTLDV